GDVRVSFRVAGYADAADAIFFKQPGADDAERILVGAFRLRRISRHDEDAVHASFSGQAGEKGFKLLARPQAAGGDVRYRLEAKLPDGGGRGDTHVGLVIRQKRYRDGGAGRQMRRSFGKVRDVLRRYFKRVVAQQLLRTWLRQLPYPQCIPCKKSHPALL